MWMCALLPFFAAPWIAAPAPLPPPTLVVVTPDWNASAGTAHLIAGERVVWGPERVWVGKKGLGWGAGLHPNPQGVAGTEGPTKAEGDRRAPAGIFAIGRTHWGARSAGLHCVDDRHSAHYNRVVALVDQPDTAPRWASAEDMTDYRVAVFVDHNPSRAPGGGSCIFLHDGERPTLGCSAFRQAAVDTLLTHKPARLVQLPAPVYDVLQDPWRLPRRPEQLAESPHPPRPAGP